MTRIPRHEIMLDAVVYVLDSVLPFLLDEPESSPSRGVWIDAICINQANIKEKASSPTDGRDIPVKSLGLAGPASEESDLVAIELVKRGGHTLAWTHCAYWSRNFCLPPNSP